MSKKTEEQRAPRLERYLGHMERLRRRSKAAVKTEAARIAAAKKEWADAWRTVRLKNRGEYRRATAKRPNRRLRRRRKRIADASRARNRR